MGFDEDFMQQVWEAFPVRKSKSKVGLRMGCFHAFVQKKPLRERERPGGQGSRDGTETAFRKGLGVWLSAGETQREPTDSESPSVSSGININMQI